jgi:hypothetical protein
MGFVVGKVALGKVSSDFDFHCQFSFHQVFQIHLFQGLAQ